MPTQKDFLFYWSVSLFIFAFVFACGRANPQTQFDNFDTVPNGTYNILLNRIDYENSIVSFVMCGESGSELHGDFKFKEGLIFPQDYWGFLKVELRNNTVMEIVDA